MSFVDLMANVVWTEADIKNRERAEVAAVVSAERQGELQTIMLGHIAQLRAATPEQLTEIMAVKDASVAAGIRAEQARADMALLHQAMAVEAAQASNDQAVVDAASPQVLALVALRAPATPAPEPPLI